jgi:mitogen-activated protein kinase kinase kinase
MFHIGVATQHPPLPEPGQLSDLGIAFIKTCLTIDALHRPSALELLDHPWMLEFREVLLRYEETESPPAELPGEERYENAAVARAAAIIQEKEVEEIRRPSPPSSVPSDSSVISDDISLSSSEL